MIKIGPAGLGPVKTAKEVLDEYHKLGFNNCEIAFTYSVYIKSQKDAKEIGDYAKKLGIDLTIHAPYFVNLNSDDSEKIEKTKERILSCCEIGEALGAKAVIFHPGYYGKDRETAKEKITEGINDMMKILKKNNWKIQLAPETMGKVNVFGSVEEISELVKKTGCSFCIDFAHILARDKEVDMKRVEKAFPGKDWHVHFSGIIYGEKGEKKHKPTENKEWTELFKTLPKDKNIRIACESPTPVEDCIEALKIRKKLNL